MEKNSNAVAGVRKRQQISAANKVVFAWVIVASIVIGICAVVAQFMVQQLMFNNKVYGSLSKTSSTISKNIKAYDGLKEEVTKLVADPSLNALKKGDTSNALQVVIDALPTVEDKTSLATSMQKEVLGPAGVAITSFAVSDGDDGFGVESTNETGVPSFDFRFTISGSYENIRNALKNIERSIRPIKVTSVEIQGSGGQIEATIQATTYYQDAKGVGLKTEKVSP